MKEDRTDRKMSARYTLTFYDWDWNEIVEMRRLEVSAHDMIMALETWNQISQRVARDPAIVIPPDPTVLSIGIEVHYVEK